ncbi:hypothetical protein [Herbaspirillum sp. B65]|uniref:hypothetical protein n=1 Tax=Herbaspirillum sp. B65 TaxID=137708 RepID=UPI0005B279CA|nr:hypothetical protein [Herbaspirillum sp. B65]
MRVRAVDAAGDALFGGDQATILRDSPDAVGQIVTSRLNLWQGQWYLDALEGTPYEQEVLGRRTEGLRDPALQARILDTPGVVEIEAYDSVLDRQTRALAVSATIQTVYSRAYLTGPSANAANITVKVEHGR